MLLAVSRIGVTVFLAVFLVVSESCAEFPSEFVEKLNRKDGQSVLSDQHKIDQILLKRIQNYLNKIGSLKADFAETNAEGKTQHGVFFLSRPGKLRWQYHPPTPILLIINGTHASYYDYELDQMSHMTLDSSLLSVLTRRKIDLTGSDLQVEHLTNIAGMIRLKLSYKGHPEHGKMTLIFQESPFMLQSLEFTDEIGNTSWIALQNILMNINLQKDLFIMKNISPEARKSNLDYE